MASLEVCLHCHEFHLAVQATTTKMSLENIDLFYLCYFTIILTRLTSTETANYPSLPWSQICRKTELKIRRCVFTFSTTNLAISLRCFAENGKEMYQNLKRTCKTTVLAHQTFCFVALSLPSLLSLLSSLIAMNEAT